MDGYLLSMVLQNIDDIKHCRKTKIPRFDFEKCSRIGFKELEISEDCGVVFGKYYLVFHLNGVSLICSIFSSPYRIPLFEP